jgi:Mg-chelatase subunit ChlD
MKLMKVLAGVVGAVAAALGLTGPVSARPQAAASVPAAQSPLTRIFILDTSGSMAGRRIRVAKGEMLALARQLPPGPERPIILIPFHAQVDRVDTFTRLADFEARLERVRAGGGTSIASGLREALVQIGKLRTVRHVCVMIYTDGEDSDEKGIARQEKKLDALFAERHKHGLKQTVVFCKRWASANARLLRAMKKYRHTRVIDLETSRMVAVTLEPKFSVVRVAWFKAGAPALEVVVEARIEVQGQTPATTLPPVGVRCPLSGAAGDVTAALIPGKTTRLTVRLPLPARFTGRKLEVPFELSEPAETVSKNGMTLPVLPLDLVKLSVDLPRRRHGLAVTVAPSGPARWKDALRRVAVAPLRLTVKVRSAQPGPWDGPVDFQVRAEGPCRVVAGQTFSLKGAGTHTQAVEVEGTLTGAAGRVPVAFRVEPGASPEHVFEPGSVRLVQALPTPAPVTTILRARARKVSAGRWVSLAEGVASFTALVDVTVQGPLTHGTVFTLVAAHPVRKVNVSPNTLRSGRQTLTIRLEAVVKPGPSRTPLVFRVRPPAPQGGVSVRVEGPLRMTVAGPAPVRLALLVNGRQQSKVELTVADGQAAEMALTARAVLAGVPPAVAAGVRYSLNTGGHLALSGDAPELAPGKTVVVRLSPTVEPSPWFFRDARLVGEIRVEASSPAVTGSTQKIVVRVQSPFKRLAFYLTLGLGGVAAAALLLGLFLKLSQRAPAYGEPAGQRDETPGR